MPAALDCPLELAKESKQADALRIRSNLEAIGKGSLHGLISIAAIKALEEIC